MDEVRGTGRWKVSFEAKLSPDRIQKEKGKTNLEIWGLIQAGLSSVFIFLEPLKDHYGTIYSTGHNL